MNNTTTPKDASQLFCPTWERSARGKVGAGNIVSHSKKRERYKCKTCGKTVSAHQGTMFEGLRKAENLIVLVVTRLRYGRTQSLNNILQKDRFSAQLDIFSHSV